MARVYANNVDLAGAPWRLSLDENTAEDYLLIASQCVEEATRTAVYDVDEQGAPTEPRVIEAFRDATCALAAWFDETGDPSGASARFNSMSLGSFSISGGGTGAPTNTSAAASRWAPHAITVLGNAGLLNQPARSW